MPYVSFQFGKKKKIPFHLFTKPHTCQFIYLLYKFLSFCLSVPSVAMSEQLKGKTTARFLQAHRVPAEEEGKSLHSTVPGFIQMWSFTAGFF